MRNNRAGRRYERIRFGERRLPHITVEVISKICPVGQIKNLAFKAFVGIEQFPAGNHRSFGQ